MGGVELVVVLDEGPRVEIVIVDVPAALLARFTVLGEKLQLTPTGVPPFAGQASVTGLEALLAGVTVIVPDAEFPAVMDEAEKLSERLKSGMLTVT